MEPFRPVPGAEQGGLAGRQVDVAWSPRWRGRAGRVGVTHSGSSGRDGVEQVDDRFTDQEDDHQDRDEADHHGLLRPDGAEDLLADPGMLKMPSVTTPPISAPRSVPRKVITGMSELRKGVHRDAPGQALGAGGAHEVRTQVSEQAGARQPT